jgi:voltage-gated potassium channel
MDPVRHLRFSVAALVSVIALGTLGYAMIEEISIAAVSTLAGENMVDSGIGQSMGIIIVGIKEADGTMIFNPPPEKKIEPNSVLIVLGERPAISRLEIVAGGKLS